MRGRIITVFGLAAVGFLAARCAGTREVAVFDTDADVSDASSADEVVISPFPDGGAFTVDPSAEQVITASFTDGGSQPANLVYTATSAGGAPATVTWSLDRGDVGNVPPGPASTATFTAKGTTGGIVNLAARAYNTTVSRSIFVQLIGNQNGPNGNPAELQQIAKSPNDLGTGGGIGGVGGEGLGVPVTDMATLTALASPASDGKAQGLAFLYPYNKTVWPRGTLAPLLMWNWTPNDADAILIKLASTSGSFTWTGTFGRPAILAQTGGAFIHHPIPQDVWTMALDTAGSVIHGSRDNLVLSVTVARNGQGYGPISQTWSVAPGRLTGTVYYNSYGTQLVNNGIVDSKGHPGGAAVLSIRSGDTGPKVAAGTSTPGGCRVCHSVSARGGRLLAQSEDPGYTDEHSHLFDLTSKAPFADQSLSPDGKFAWAAMTSDGSLAMTNAVPMSCINPGVTNQTSELYKMSGSPTLTNMSGFTGAAGYPSFSPDDKFLTYIDVTGSTGDVKGPLMIAGFNASTHAFSSPTKLATPANGQRIGFPAFLPDDKGVVYETQTRDGGTSGVEGFWCADHGLVTRAGARGELWWVNAAGAPKPVPLTNLNGKGYLPIGPNNHGIVGGTDTVDPYSEVGLDDTTLNYEPTILPVAGGGYAWVIFTSRRMYGNELQAVPYMSWPGAYDMTNIALGTVKKLWVAALDLNAPPGSDPSFPAFYLPAQELLAGNSRGFWVLDPCKADGQSCGSGDQCCNGYCEASDDGGLVCSPPPACSHVSDKCTKDADCCDGTNLCVGGYCSLPTPPN